MAKRRRVDSSVAQNGSSSSDARGTKAAKVSPSSQAPRSSSTTLAGTNRASAPGSSSTPSAGTPVYASPPAYSADQRLGWQQSQSATQEEEEEAIDLTQADSGPVRELYGSLGERYATHWIGGLGD